MNSKQKHKLKRKKTSGSRRNGPKLILISVVIIILIAAAFLLAPYWTQYLKDMRTEKSAMQDQINKEIVQKPEKPDTIQQLQAPDSVQQQEAVSQKTSEEPVIQQQETKEDEATSPEKTAMEICKEITGSIVSFYDHLDNQTYIQDSELKSKSGTYFTTLIQKLLDNPPIVSRETDDLFTILQNTAHFFRVIGKKNIVLIKGILHNEKDSFENIVAKYYNFVQQRNCSMDRLTLKLPDNALYDYAGFFLNTMGGRLYLFRRDSKSRMVIIYYALLIVDQANNSGNNHHGIQISHAIDSLIDEIESVGGGLKMQEKYLDKLYDLQEKYQQ